MAKATTTLRQVLNYHPHHTAWFAATQVLFNQVAAFYFEVITAHEGDTEHGTAQGVWLGMAEHTSDIPRQLRLFNES